MDMVTVAELNQEKSLVLSWKITDVNQKMEKKTCCESEVFPLHDYNIGAQARVQLKSDNYVAISLSFHDLSGERKETEPGETGPIVKFKASPQITYILRDRSGNEENKDMIRIMHILFNEKLSYDFFFDRLFDNKSLLLNSVYDVEDTFVVDVLVEPAEIAEESFSHDGVVTWDIDGFSKRKWMAEQQLHWGKRSPYFYTSPEGYRVQAEYFMNGFGTGPVVMVSFLMGEFDSSLSTSFKHKATLTIFNQKDPSKDLIKSVEYDIKEMCGFYTFDDTTSHDEIENGGFVENDTIRCKVVIEALNS